MMKLSEAINEVATVLQNACIEEFGSNWNNDVARRFARLAVGKWQEIENKEKKMTRQEAERLVVKWAYNANNDQLFNGFGQAPEKQFVNALEALGLIKFEENNNCIPHFRLGNMLYSLEEIEKALSLSGYRVMQK